MSENPIYEQIKRNGGEAGSRVRKSDRRIERRNTNLEELGLERIEPTSKPKYTKEDTETGEREYVKIDEAVKDAIGVKVGTPAED